jgi:hypothetical protein
MLLHVRADTSGLGLLHMLLMLLLLLLLSLAAAVRS